MAAPVLDEATLRQMITDLDAPRVLEILDIFSGEAAARVQRIAGNAGDLEGLEHEAHALKSTAGTFGAPALSEVARALEEAAANGDADAVARLVPEIEAAAGRALAALAEFKSAVGSAG